jgi:YbbR domain-containing protein
MIAFLRQLVLKDFWLKLFSLSLAFLTWITVSFAIQKEGTPAMPSSTTIMQRTFYNLPVQVVSSEADVHAYKVDPGEIEVTVQGDPKKIADLQSKDIRPIVDVTGEKPAPGLRKLVMVSIPDGVAYLPLKQQEVGIIFPVKEREHAGLKRPGDSL